MSMSGGGGVKRFFRRKARLLAACSGIIALTVVAPAWTAARSPGLHGCGTRLPAIKPSGWLPARSRLVPANPEHALLCRTDSRGEVVVVAGVDPVVARELPGEFDALPVSTGPISARCAREHQPRVLARFGYPSGHVVSVLVELGGCAAVSNGAVSGYATGRYGQVIHDLNVLTNGPSPLKPALVHARGAPGCSTATAPARTLADVPTADVALPGAPFGIVTTGHGGWSFAALANGKIAVLRNAGFAPSLVRVVSLSEGVAGAALTHDGRYLLAAAGHGAVVLSTARLESGLQDPVLGTLSVRDQIALGAIEVTTTRNDRYAFVSLEYSDDIAVFDLHDAIAHRFRSSAFIGTIPLGRAVVGTALSPDGKWLYATSELASAGQQGTLSVIDVRRAETDPLNSVKVNVSAGCGPVRVNAAPGGRTVWVTARESNMLLGFSTAKLLHHPRDAITAKVRVGQAPVGLAVIKNGREIVVANSNRFSRTNATGSLSVINTVAALNHQPAIIGSLPTGVFPRETSLEPNGTLLIGDFGSQQIQAIATAQLP
jgi:DNA-binding beta-propeller fold protein YncE